MKEKTDKIEGFKGSVLIAKCIKCGITPDDVPQMGFWVSDSGDTVCANCNTMMLAGTVKSLLHQIADFQDESAKVLSQTIKNAGKTIALLTEKIAKLEGKK